MYDAKMEELARQIVQYSVGLQPGENLLIESWDGADDMTAALIEAAYQAGGYPFVCREDAAVQRRLLLGGSEESFRRRAEVELARMEKMDACFEKIPVKPGEVRWTTARNMLMYQRKR